MEKFSYIKIPVSMIPLLYNGRSGLIDVLLYGIYNTAKFDCSPENMARQLLYTYMCQDPNKRRASIPSQLEEILDCYDNDSDNELTENEYRGFSKAGNEFNPSSSLFGELIETLCRLFNSNPNIYKLAKDFYCIRQCAEMLGIQVTNTDSILQRHEWYQEHDSCRVFAYAKLDNFTKLIDKGDNLTNEDIELLVGYLAFKSILGRNKVGRAEKSLVLARMMGYVSPNNIEDDGSNIDSPSLLRIFRKYSDKENFRRLVGRLREGYIKYIEVMAGKPRYGYFFSFSRDLSKMDFFSAIDDLVVANKKESARNRKRLERKRKKMKCRKQVGTAEDLPKPKKTVSPTTSKVQNATKQIPFKEIPSSASGRDLLSPEPQNTE
jgi:hypothetical protein